MECLTNLKQICDRLGENLNSPTCQELKAHLAECTKCCAYVDSIKKTVYLYQCLNDEQDVPDSVDKRLWKVLNLRPPDERLQFSSKLRQN